MLLTTVLVAATVATGLSAGIFAAFSCAVMPGLRRCDDDTFVAAMRHINDAILNGWFYLAFVGSPVLTAAALVLGLVDSASATVWIGAALVLYLVNFGITIGINVPLNERLNAATGEATAAREAFEGPWNRWHLTRTIFSILAVVCLCVALTV
ncbi:putative membrane protein [Stackebrandtia endophytica]|uniref:Putative membrane protein n=1 Tax=Stackebrandtia endophytica TaxID=1496996 RepID=A0A543AVH2_9ACTN|nr:anthrone oxygenase family protein [Stackebrandtia endophytica]TQL76575.1 putative membrane protein [Stackebrandtia endophytica]